MTTGRLEAFSDGCIAIFITVILLTFQIPGGDTYRDLIPMIPAFIGYAISFIVIGIYWGNHHHLVHSVENVTGRIMWANLAWLFCLSIVSFATAWAGQRMMAPQTVSFYGMVLLACNISYVILERAIAAQEKIEAEKNGKECTLSDRLGGKWKERAAFALYLTGAIVALDLPRLAILMYTVVNIIWFVPDRRVTKNNKC